VSSSVRNVSIAACLLLVLLRVSIGWQFLYEGLWKLDTQSTAKPWSAEGYLTNARGPFRDRFRALVEDRDGLRKLDFATMTTRWDDWRDRFLTHYPTLTDNQKQRLQLLLEGPGEFREPLEALPEGVDLKKFKPRKYKAPEGWYLRYNAKGKRLETNLHLVPEEREALLKMAEPQPSTDDERAAAADPRSPPPVLSPEEQAYQGAIRKLCERAGKLSLKERLQVLLAEDLNRNGVVLEAHAGTVDHRRPGERQVYEHLVARYEKNLKGVKETFQQEHLARQYKELMEKRAELLGPVDALTAEYHAAAYKLLDIEQTAKGPVPPADSELQRINRMTIWSLIVLGGALMAGLFSRIAALGAAGLLLLFYLPMPPWPGVPEAPGPEHSLFVNKNLIEMFACLALAALPTGRWIGLDALVRRVLLFRKTD
jgi:uncharacterized membrane protein YphA (DoxX/SURF4 family)